jgi:hypothetical protein
MLRAGDMYYQHAKIVETNQETNQNKTEHRSSLNGAWFFTEQAVSTSEEWWKSTLTFRIAIIISIVHYSLFAVSFIRGKVGFTGGDNALDIGNN